jgi:hypothetical protein
MRCGMRTALLAGALLASLGAADRAAVQPAEGAAVFDPLQLPEVKGAIARYTLTPRGDVDGFILTDGTELRLPPPEAARFAALLTPGRTVAARGPGLRGPLGTEISPPPRGRRPPPPRG